MNFADAHDIKEHTTLFTTLAKRLLDDDLPADSPDRAHLLRLLSSLMQAADKDARRAVIENTARRAAPPKDLAMLLARDNADLAAPVLRSVPFTQTELIELVTRTGPAHHIEIARRADLTLDVWLALARAAARRVHGGETGIEDRQQAGPSPSPAVSPASPNQISGQAAYQSAPRPAPESEYTPRPAPEPAPAMMHDIEDRPTYQAPADSGMQYEQTASPEQYSARQNEPLHDIDDKSWQFETTRSGRIFRLSPNAHMAFGPGSHALVGDYFASVLQSQSAAPAPDEIGQIMANHAPLRDIVIETMVGQGPPRRWKIRGRPRFSFPDGRFEGYCGTAYNMDADEERRRPLEEAPGNVPRNAGELLDRMARAADRLAAQTSSPELEDYARTMRDCVDSLKSMSTSLFIDTTSKDRYGRG